MPDAAPNTDDLFKIIRTTRSMRRLKPDPVPNDLIRKILEAAGVGEIHAAFPRRLVIKLSATTSEARSQAPRRWRWASSALT